MHNHYLPYEIKNDEVKRIWKAADGKERARLVWIDIQIGKCNFSSLEEALQASEKRLVWLSSVNGDTTVWNDERKEWDYEYLVGFMDQKDQYAHGTGTTVFIVIYLEGGEEIVHEYSHDC